jgi:transposase InsO family protein
VATREDWWAVNPKKMQRLWGAEGRRDWAIEVDLVSITPGQPWRNGFIGSFNGRLRDGCLSVNQFYSLSDAKDIIGMWKEDYNTARPHSSLGYLAPTVYVKKCTHKKLRGDPH